MGESRTRYEQAYEQVAAREKDLAFARQLLEQAGYEVIKPGERVEDEALAPGPVSRMVAVSPETEQLLEIKDLLHRSLVSLNSIVASLERLEERGFQGAGHG